ncbi:MAG: hypothetical protein PHN68_11945 [Prolixibacteraceae bacterium]|jgi:hypothetical protein|nr:hypothetical protein [Prolixibacteraceae bacterium]
MKRRKTILRILSALILAPSILISCIDDPEPPILDALPDVFFQKVYEGGEEKYAIAFWIFGNKELESVTIDGPEGGTWDLESDNMNPQIFSLFPAEEDYLPEIPAAGVYEFTVTSTQEGEPPMKIDDELEDEELAIVTIDSIKFESSQVKTYWETVTGADNYRVRLYNDSGDIIFLSNQLADNKTDFSFSITDDGWVDSGSIPVTGENCRLEVLAILYESGASVDKDYNIQCISITSEDIEWEF